VTTTAAGTVVTRRIDRHRGLVFEVESSTDERNVLTVALTDDAPARMRAAVLPHLLSGGCEVPGKPMLRFFGRWDRRARSCETELARDGPGVVVAREATVCELYAGRPARVPKTAEFHERPFGRVRMR
jgi:hypothetical protein